MSLDLLRLPTALFQEMLAHARQSAPDECVGLLLGQGDTRTGTATRRVLLENTAPTPRTRFFADPSGLLRALREADRRGEVLLALYHSHPRGPAEPSEADLENAHYDALTLIVTLRPEGVRAFRVRRSGFEEVGLEVGGA